MKTISMSFKSHKGYLEDLLVQDRGKKKFRNPTADRGTGELKKGRPSR